MLICFHSYLGALSRLNSKRSVVGLPAERNITDDARAGNSEWWGFRLGRSWRARSRFSGYGRRDVFRSSGGFIEQLLTTNNIKT